MIAGGRIVAFPTETFYGLGVDPRHGRAVRALFRLKGRRPERAVPLIAANLEQVQAQIGRLSDVERRLARRFWPGSLALVLAAPPELGSDLLGGGTTVAVRVPGHATARALCARAGYPLSATSANRSGEPPATTADDVVTVFGDTVALVLDAGATPGGRPSTIVRITGTEPALVREGAVPWARVLEFLGRDD